VIEQVLADNLTETAAYKLEYDKLREYVFAGKRDQLWNVIPTSIQTPQELQAFTECLRRNLNSRDRWIRYLSGRTLAELIREQQRTGYTTEMDPIGRTTGPGLLIGFSPVPTPAALARQAGA
jgi:hypothetical protein